MLSGSLAYSDILISMQNDKLNWPMLLCLLEASSLVALKRLCHVNFHIFIFISTMPNYQCRSRIFWVFDISRRYHGNFVLQEYRSITHLDSRSPVPV